MSIHVGNPASFSSVKEAVRDIPASELNRPTVSTIPMLSLMIHAEGQFNEIVRKIAMDEYQQLILEYKAGPFEGKGQASHTDVMLLNANQSLAIEAKWTESMYPKVSKWRKSGKDEINRNAVLRGWFSKLADSPDSMIADEYGHLIYQMVHRASSAASASDNPHMAYFLFQLDGKSKGAKPKRIAEELEKLWLALGQPFPFYSVQIPMKEASGYRQIKNLKKGTETSAVISEVLQGDKQIFKFLEPTITRIGEDA